MKKVFIAALLAFSLSACIKGYFMEGSKIYEDNVSRIKIGQTTRDDILKWFGPPVEFQDPKTLKMILRTLDLTAETPAVDHPFEDAFVYEYTYAKTSGFSIIIYTYIKTDSKKDLLMVFFGDDDKVQYFAFRKGTEEF
ncbi:MAG TPA: hypothetical protein VJL89_14260 [Thermodesulfovibrionia bacterium]|nr:hypothetical protein [Thermodesulfovibrionia bacterium]